MSPARYCQAVRRARQRAERQRRARGRAASEHWTARFSRPIIFIILTLVGDGHLLAFTIPVAVFPSTDFPRIVVGVDNGVAPINQMQVTVTRPIEEAMNSVPGLDRCVRSPAAARPK